MNFTEDELLFVTTTDCIDGYKISECITVVNGESVIGTGIFSEHDARVSDRLGGEASAYTSKLDYAKQRALKAMRENAATRRANAVVGVSIAITVVNNNMFVVSATGTAVKVIPEDEYLAKLEEIQEERRSKMQKIKEQERKMAEDLAKRNEALESLGAENGIELTILKAIANTTNGEMSLMSIANLFPRNYDQKLIMEAVRALEEKGLINKTEAGTYSFNAI